MTQGLPYTFVESSGGAKIHGLPLEVFPGFWAYAYVSQKDEFCALIDTGSGTEKSHQDLLDGLREVGMRPSDLTHILLTHAHIDHYGGLSPLRPITQAKIGVHELDLQTVAYHEENQALLGRRFASFLLETGLAEDKRNHLLSMYHFTEAFYRSVPVDFTYEGTDMVLGPFEFIHLPGHCPGHVAIRLDDVVFCGDMVVEGITPHLSPESVQLYSGLDHYLESLSHLRSWARGAHWIFNGHDRAVTDLPAQIDATRVNICRRIGRGMDALAESLTIEEICLAIYGDMDGYNQLLVMEKTGAYVEYLYLHGMIGITNPIEVEQGKPARYRRFREVSAESDLLPKERAYVFI
jgi:glyoxylase-like metal-dependent hydrolase (beta-lactamase superfamily II)